MIPFITFKKKVDQHTISLVTSGVNVTGRRVQNECHATTRRATDVHVPSLAFTDILWQEMAQITKCKLQSYKKSTFPFTLN